MKKSLLALVALMSIGSVQAIWTPARPTKIQGGVLALALPYWRLYQKRSLAKPAADFTLSPSDANFATSSNLWKIIDQGFIGQRFSAKTVTVDDVKIQHANEDKPASGVLGKFDANVVTPVKKSLPQLALLLAFLRAANGDLKDGRNPFTWTDLLTTR